MNFISREDVLAILDAHKQEQWAVALRSRIEGLFSFPAPNPKGLYDRNVMGQTEEQFWDDVDKNERQ
jgi:hypothetical protein